MTAPQLVKVVLLGNSGVGKTNIALRFTENKFIEELMPSTAASMRPRELQIPGCSQTFKINIWDTAGQEKYRSIASTYYKDAQAAILVYDTTNKDSFEGIQFWLNELKENNKEEIVLVIAGNKCDLIDREAVRYEDAKQLADEMHAKFFMTSAKDGTGVDPMFLEICAELRPDVKESVDRAIRQQKEGKKVRT